MKTALLKEKWHSFGIARGVVYDYSFLKIQTVAGLKSLELFGMYSSRCELVWNNYSSTEWRLFTQTWLVNQVYESMELLFC